MNFSEKVAEIEGKVKSYKLKIECVEKIPAEDMVRVMFEEGKMLEPCRILGESDDYIDFMVVDLENGPIFFHFHKQGKKSLDLALSINH